NSPSENSEEFAIHDFEGFGNTTIDEYESINDVASFANFIAKHGELGAELLSHYPIIEEAEKILDENYHGAYDSEVDFARALFDEFYDDAIPENLKCYVDYDALAR